MAISWLWISGRCLSVGTRLLPHIGLRIVWLRSARNRKTQTNCNHKKKSQALIHFHTIRLAFEIANYAISNWQFLLHNSRWKWDTDWERMRIMWENEWEIDHLHTAHSIRHMAHCSFDTHDMNKVTIAMNRFSSSLLSFAFEGRKNTNWKK